MSKEHLVGTWIELDDDGEHKRLLRIAASYLRGAEHHAEDVVTRALMKWRTIPADRQPVARLEQVMKSEARSLLRSERRAQDRERRWAADRALTSNPDEIDRHLELWELTDSLIATARSVAVEIDQDDLVILDLMLQGMRVADICRCTTLTRYQVRRSRAKWQTCALAMKR